MSFTKNPWIAFRRRAVAPQFRLFCLPYAGAGALTFRPLAAKLPSSIDVCPVELPGRGTRMTEPSSANIDELVAGIANGISDLLDLPFGLFGHSMGALLAYDLTRYLLDKQQIKVDHLFISGMRAAHLPNRHPPIATLAPQDLLLKIKSLGGTPASIWEPKHRELRELMAAILKADFHICDNYQYKEGAPLDTPIVAFGGDNDPFFTPDEIHAWATHTTVSFQSHIFPGGHFFINDALSPMAQAISQGMLRDQALVACAEAATAVPQST